MKRIFCISVILFSTWILYAQENPVFYKHELKLSAGPTLYQDLWFHDKCYGNLTVAYFYSPHKLLGVGVNFVNYFGEKLYYDWREYNADGTFNDFSKSKTKHCFAIAPEVRLSYLNKEIIMLYSAVSGGIGWEYGYDDKWKKYPQKFRYLHVTCFGFNCNFGKNNKIFLGGELGIGLKGFINMQGGYRF